MKLSEADRETIIRAMEALPADLFVLERLIGSIDTLIRGGHACRHDLTLTRECAGEYGLDWGALEPWLRDSGGSCDCEVVRETGARLRGIADWLEQERRRN